MPPATRTKTTRSHQLADGTIATRRTANDYTHNGAREARRYGWTAHVEQINDGSRTTEAHR